MHSFDYNELLLKHRYTILIIIVGLIFVGFGILLFKNDLFSPSSKVEILQGSKESSEDIEIIAEISGEVIKPGVYKFSNGARVDDLLISAGGFSAEADRVWADKYLNRAAKLSDGQKIFIPSVNQQSDVLSAKNGVSNQNISPSFISDSSGLININTASVSELDNLPGIGPVYAQKIIEHRPYSKIEDLVSNGAITQTIYEKIKNLITIY